MHYLFSITNVHKIGFVNKKFFNHIIIRHEESYLPSPK